MKRYVKAATYKYANLVEGILDLAKDMLYQTWENRKYDGLTKQDVFDSIVDHVRLVICEMDDDGNYAKYKKISEIDPTGFTILLTQAAKRALEEDGDQYEWE